MSKWNWTIKKLKTLLKPHPNPSASPDTSALEKQATEDAQAGKANLADLVLTARHGVRSEFDPSANEQHMVVNQKIALAPQIEEKKAHTASISEELCGKPSLWALYLGLGVFFLMECAGSIMLATALGAVHPFVKLLVAVTVTVALVSCSYAIARIARSGGNTLKLWGLLLAGSTVVVAIAWWRINQISNPFTSSLDHLASMVIIMAITIAPAICIEWLLERAAAVKALTDLRTQLRAEIRQLQQKYDEAEQWLVNHAQARERANQVWAKEQAVYTLAYTRAKDDGEKS